MAEKYFCLIDVHYYDEETYIPRHEKAILWVESFEEAYDLVKNQVEDNIDKISFAWAGKDGKDCKQELFFTESEFDRFNIVKEIIEDDKSYEDYKRIVLKGHN